MPADGKSIATLPDLRNPERPAGATHASPMPGGRQGAPGLEPNALFLYPQGSNPAPPVVTDRIASLLATYNATGNLGAFLDAMRALVGDMDADSLIQAAEPFREHLEVIIPVYERVVELRPDDARALVTLANAYWLTQRGPDVVAELATRAKRADPANRAAWHLWALAEPDIRERTNKWRVVSERFPSDQLARAALADNAASLAGAEHDPLALDLAIATYEGLLRESISPTQTRALQDTLATLRSWKL